jgi:hypothetical protein
MPELTLPNEHRAGVDLLLPGARRHGGELPVGKRREERDRCKPLDIHRDAPTSTGVLGCLGSVSRW